MTSGLLAETEVGQVETIGSDSRRENLTSQLEWSQDSYILTLSCVHLLHFDKRRSETDGEDVRNGTHSPGSGLSKLTRRVNLNDVHMVFKHDQNSSSLMAE